ncbi:MAG: ABC transporter substrate-binding protein [Lachnospiraceae bacterium]|nr:ABC transporter substrate-binding protein [Lachnospiraceae bacterium]
MHRTSGRLHSKRLVLVLILLLILTGCSNSQEEKKQDSAGRENAAWDGALTHDISAQLVYTHSMQKDHAQQFSVDYYEDGYALITLCDGSQFLSVPEGRDGQPPAVPEDLPERITVLQQPVGNIYLAASAAMDMFRAMDALDCITLSGIEQNSWHIEEAREAMEQGRITYAGKYSAPDYELIKAKGCTLSVQSTMLEHVPEVREQLELLGIHVFEDHSSYEESPMGRMEWIKVYGVLTGHEKEAEEAYEAQKKAFEEGTASEPLDLKVAFFNVTSTGAINIRKPEDYIAKMIRLAGGTYALDGIEAAEGATGTMNIQMEQFYAEAQDADVLIYNSTIAGEIHSRQELLDKNPLFADFQAVQKGNVWCMSADFFQNSMELGTAVEDIHNMLLQTGSENTAKSTDGEFTFLYRLE